MGYSRCVTSTILVIGGVAGGMSAAARLRRLDEDAHIIVLERGPHVSFANCGLPYYVGGEIADQSALLVQTPESLAASLALDVRPGHDVVGIDPAAKTVQVRTSDGQTELAYDVLIVSPGVVAARPPVPGLDHPLVHTLRTVDDAIALRELAQGATRAVVLGAGFIGLEAAEALRGRGIDVDLIELADHVLPPLDAEPAWWVTSELKRLGIRVHTSTSVTGIADADGRARVTASDGTVVDADLVVLSAGTRPDTAVFEAAGMACERGSIVVDDHGRTNLPDVYAAGDATVSVDAVTAVRRPVQLAGPANRAGRLVADALRQESPRRIPRPLGTAIVRVGELAAAITGANRAALTAAGREFATIRIHPADHAGYFPGATTMHLLVHIDPSTGQILGAQGVGANGVDKRIDVLATAMRGGLRAPDLMDLDLCYAPPFGSAKDPVTMIGFVADNVLTGQTTLAQVEDLEQLRAQALVLDVRSAGEFASGHIPEAVNIPHTQLRGRLDEVRQLAGGRAVTTVCGVGVRSYIAQRVLSAAGFQASSLAGGMTSVRAWFGDDADAVLVKEDAR